MQEQYPSVIRAIMRRTYNAWREVNILDYHNRRKALAQEITNLATRMGLTEEEATKIMLETFHKKADK